MAQLKAFVEAVCVVSIKKNHFRCSDKAAYSVRFFFFLYLCCDAISESEWRTWQKKMALASAFAGLARGKIVRKLDMSRFFSVCKSVDLPGKSPA